MSDTQFSTGQPVYPPATTPAATVPATPPIGATIPDPQGLPDTVEIEGRKYRWDEVEEMVTNFRGMQDAHTKRSQNLAEERRLAQAELDAARRELEELRRERNADRSNRRPEPPIDEIFGEPTDDVEELNRRLGHVAREITRVSSMIEDDRKARDEGIRKIHAEDALEGALDRFENYPYFNRDEMRNYIKSRGWSSDHVADAYQALYSYRLGVRRGERDAVTRGASRPTVMGAGQSSVSPGFTSPSEVPGIDQQYQNLTMRQLRDLAMQDPEISSR